MCDKGVNTYPFTIKFVSQCFMTQEVCQRVVSSDSLSIRYDPDQYKT